MGKRDKRKDKRKARKSEIAAKQEKKLLKGELKQQRKTARKLGEAELDDDVEILVAQFRHRQKAHEDVEPTIEECSCPGPRLNAILVHHPINKREVVLFGGEFWNGRVVRMYNDMFFFRPDKNIWREVSSSYAPAPRSAHQGVIYKHYMFVFGGEYTAPSQNTSLHFRDLWRFNFKDNRWVEVTLKGGPTARSGHRMVVLKKSIVVFGGFHNAGLSADAVYYNDIWMLGGLDDELFWDGVAYGPLDDVPAPRSGCCMAAYEDEVFVYGGYSGTAHNPNETPSASAAPGASSSSGSSSSSSSAVAIVRSVVPGGSDFRGCCHHDLWSFHVPTMKWRRMRIQGIAPSIRSGVASCVWNKKMFLYGGVWDYDEGSADLHSVFYNDLYTFNMESRRFFASRIGRSGAADKPGFMEDEVEQIKQQQEAVGHSGRINALLTVADNTLYVYGGMREEGKVEVALNDMYSIHANKTDQGWSTVFDLTASATQKWEEEEDDEEENSDDSDDSDESDEDSDTEKRKKGKKGKKKEKKVAKAKTEESSSSSEGSDTESSSSESESSSESSSDEVKKKKEKGKGKEKKDEGVKEKGKGKAVEEEAKASVSKSKKKAEEAGSEKDEPKPKEEEEEPVDYQAAIDSLLRDLAVAGASGVPVPNPSEKLPEFFKRTQEFWMNEARLSLADDGDSTKNKKDEEDGEDVDEEAERLVSVEAFLLAKNCFKGLRPLLEKLESTQKAAAASTNNPT